MAYSYEKSRPHLTESSILIFVSHSSIILWPNQPPEMQKIRPVTWNFHCKSWKNDLCEVRSDVSIDCRSFFFCILETIDADP